MLSPMLLGLGWFSSLFCFVELLLPSHSWTVARIKTSEVTVAHGGVVALFGRSNVSGCLTSIGKSHLQSMRPAEEESTSCVHLLFEYYMDARFG